MSEINYKPFDLEKAKAGAKIMTRDGRPARIICTDSKGELPIIALVLSEGGEYEYPYNYSNKGMFCEATISPLDLVMYPIRHEGWVNVYSNQKSTWTGNVFKTQVLAEEGKDSRFFVQTIKIEWEE